MSKKVLILNGSPRSNGNTVGLIEAFTKGAESSGNTVTRFDLEGMSIHPCMGCLGGGKDPEFPCTQNDDMDVIYPVYKEADVVVFASPMYYWAFTAQLKAVLDRLFAVTEADPNYVTPFKECIVLMPAGDDSPENNEPVEVYYKALMSHLGWKGLGLLIAGGVMEVGDIRGKPVLKEAEALGALIR